ncbi:MAG: hypothetical protein WBI55_05690 [Eubacteriales bacterium]|jgi:hypothetical protein|nr:hypothetical protein [Clostridiales bacterium]
MRIDKNAINKLLKQSDDQLWRTLQMIASLNGIDMSKVSRPTNMSKLRSILSNLTDNDIGRAVEILESYRKSGK